jgi:hypothetical protein
MLSQKEFKLKTAFKVISQGQQVIIADSLSLWMSRTAQELGHPQPLRDDIRSIMRRVDLNGDRKILWGEFSEAFTLLPLSIKSQYSPRPTVQAAPQQKPAKPKVEVINHSKL